MYATSGSSGNVTYSCVLGGGGIVGQIQSQVTTTSVGLLVCNESGSCTSGEGAGYAEATQPIYSSYPGQVGGSCSFYVNGTEVANLRAS